MEVKTKKQIVETFRNSNCKSVNRKDHNIQKKIDLDRFYTTCGKNAHLVAGKAIANCFVFPAKISKKLTRNINIQMVKLIKNLNLPSRLEKVKYCLNKVKEKLNSSSAEVKSVADRFFVECKNTSLVVGRTVAHLIFPAKISKEFKRKINIQMIKSLNPVNRIGKVNYFFNKIKADLDSSSAEFKSVDLMSNVVRYLKSTGLDDKQRAELFQKVHELSNDLTELGSFKTVNGKLKQRNNYKEIQVTKASTIKQALAIVDLDKFKELEYGLSSCDNNNDYSDEAMKRLNQSIGSLKDPPSDSASSAITPGTMVLHPSSEDSTNKIVDMIMNAKSFVVLESFVFTEGSSQAQKIITALKNKADQCKRDDQNPPFKAVFLINKTTNRIIKQGVKADGYFGQLDSQEWTDKKGGKNLEPPKEMTSLKDLVKLVKGNPFVEFDIVAYQHEGRDLDHKKLYVADGVNVNGDNDINLLVPIHNIAGVHTDTLNEEGVRKFHGTQDIGTSVSGEVASDAAKTIFKTIAERGKVKFSSRLSKPSAHELSKQMGKVLELANPDRTESDKNQSAVFASQNSGLKITSHSSVSPALIGIKSLFHNAQKSIKIMTPNLQSQDLLNELRLALARGVKVELLLPEGMNQDHVQMAGATNDLSAGALQEMLEHIPDHFKDNLQIRWFRDPDNNAPFDWSAGTNHTKLYIADDDIVGTGSYNLDYQSYCSAEDMLFFRQSETDVIAESKDPDSKGLNHISFFKKMFNRGDPQPEHIGRFVKAEDMVALEFKQLAPTNTHFWVGQRPYKSA